MLKRLLAQTMGSNWCIEMYGHMKWVHPLRGRNSSIHVHSSHEKIQTPQTIGFWHSMIGFLAIGNGKLKGNSAILNRRISYDNSVWHLLLSLWIQNQRNSMSAIFIDCKILNFIMHRICLHKKNLFPKTGIGSTKEGTKPTTHPQILIYMIVESMIT